jgi:hypothetical protein
VEQYVIERSVKGGPVVRRRYTTSFLAYAQLAHELGKQDAGLEHLARLGRLTEDRLPFEATIGGQRWVLMAAPATSPAAAAVPASP